MRRNRGGSSDVFDDIAVVNDRLEFNDGGLDRIEILEPSIDYFDENGSVLNSQL